MAHLKYPTMSKNPTKEQRSRWNKTYRHKHPEKVKESSDKYCEARREEIAETGRQYRIDHPEEIAERRKTDRAVRPERAMFHAAKNRAKKRGLPFNIDKSDIVIPDVCPVLGIPLASRGALSMWSPSLDRIEPALGYVKGNVRVISHRANMLLLNSTLEEARLIYEDRKRTHGSKP
jgi:hypothetical protein